MNEWEKKSADDACCKGYAYDYPSNLKSSDYISTVRFDYEDYFVKKSKWSVLKDKTVRTLKRLFICAPNQLIYSIKELFVNNNKRELEIVSLKYELEACKTDRDHYRQSNELLRSINENLTKTLSAWMAMDNDAYMEQLSQKKKAAKKRPSNKKKRKG